MYRKISDSCYRKIFQIMQLLNKVKQDIKVASYLMQDFLFGFYKWLLKLKDTGPTRQSFENHILQRC